ncbi:phosphoribosyl transferase [Rhodoferax lacus]|uniref:Phosphoribosyl transferase n=1 Tax=Rhodoferax lacus TaxID=2184758 RepID=A0A3E1RGM2_9BURK|nr:phosphoribosyltransferase family protein [Rhodoferax lacus]RFO97750.1 phosphoribosyl transferase [Rhodoferax lacus]
MFRDRTEAAQLLLEELQPYKGLNPLVLAIPRGAVPMGRCIAEGLGGTLDVVLVRKLRAPLQPELAIGAIDENGWTYLTEHATHHDVSADYIAQEKLIQLQTLRARRAQYTPGRLPTAVQHRIVIVVDDGLATGATMVAALHGLRAQRPAKLVCAVPVAAPTAATKVRPLVDALVCLKISPDFQAVGQFYRDFRQVEDEEVIALLNGTRQALDQ